MNIKKKFFVLIFLLHAFKILCALPLAEQFQRTGYLEIINTSHGESTFESLYASFDEFIEFLQANPKWSQKLYVAKERFIRSKNQKYYSSDFFGFYDESKSRSQIAFYYSTHFHEFVCTHYPEFKQVIPIKRFFDTCRDIQEPYVQIFNQAATELGLETIFDGNPPILFKVIKYLPSYNATRPHYDGTAFSLFLHSTDNQSLLLSAYRCPLEVNDFCTAIRAHQNSILLIPGSLLAEFSIYPTPHIVAPSGHIRYATIAFAMRPNHTHAKNEFCVLPKF